MEDLSWSDFEKVQLCAGTIVDVQTFPEARKPAYKLVVDFGSEIGQRKSSAQITEHYTPESLMGRQVLAVINFPPKQIGPFRSECLVAGFYREDGSVILAVPDQAVSDGARLG